MAAVVSSASATSSWHCSAQASARAASAARPAPGLARQLRESEFLVLSHIVALPVTAQLRLKLLQVQV